MKNDLLIIYNTCGISGKDNSSYYTEALKSIRSQSFTDYRLVLSACRNNQLHLENICAEVKVDILNNISDTLPVNITFNQAVRVAVAKYGEFKGYLYLDSGIKFTDPNQLTELYNLFVAGNFGMVSAQVDNDFGWCWFGVDEYSRPRIKEPFLVPVGKAVNLHCQIFSNDLLRYYGHVIPDIFKSYCTESVFSFLNAAIKKQWVVSPVYVHHQFTVPAGQPDNGDGLDGHSSGFRDPPGTWDSIYPPQTMREICDKAEGTKFGFGYEELRGIKMHDPSCFDSNQFCTNDNLKVFLKDNLYRKDFEYSKINQKTVCYQ